MLSALKLKVMVKAVQIRITRGEEMESIISQYMNLDDEEKTQLREAVTNAAESD